MSEERLQKVLARAGVASRRKVEELIREARVTINGKLAEIGDKADLERDAVKIDGKRVAAKAGAHRYLILNKPRGVMSTVADPEGRTTVLDLVPPAMRKALVPVGRLDFLTEGLILLTDDGDFAQHVAHPRYGCIKTYEVKVKGHPEEGDIARLEAGIVLDGKRTSPCRITPRPAPRRSAEGLNSWWIVELTEGRTRQIRDMFERIGHPVQKLRRVAIGPLHAPELGVGSLRELTEREVEQLRRSTREPQTTRGVKRAAKPKSPTSGKSPGKPAAKRLAPDARPAAKRLAASGKSLAAAGKSPAKGPAKPAKRLAPGKGAPGAAKRLAPGGRPAAAAKRPARAGAPAGKPPAGKRRPAAASPRTSSRRPSSRPSR
ncbi:MAG: rRNA synthase [Acidobacteriota bacterium]|jgi:23S rRNA pseudouridine2605 synthase|nr:rRNA synthase [Acidobacteriota bacterium]